ncbi:MAG TPA: hypothetical protein VGU46_08945 [Acidobacteriaceae bacterium]|nr:hypothetical protein [Acidobacteriaceae bacterium]
MSFLRKVAVRVTEFTMRHASAGSREWAKGLACEVEFIESDWRALAWAVGSTRVLLDRRGVRAGSDQDVKPKAIRIYDFNFLIWYFPMAWDSVASILKARSPWDRTSAYLVGLAVANWGVTSILDWRRKRGQPWFGSENYLPFLRKELELKLARPSTVRSWFPVLVAVFGIGGWVMHIEGGMHLHHISSALWIAFAVFIVRAKLRETPAAIQKKIELMDERIAESHARKALWGQPDKPARSDHWGRAEAAGAGIARTR